MRKDIEGSVVRLAVPEDNWRAARQLLASGRSQHMFLDSWGWTS